jgi:hypothetical protein
MIEDSGHTGSAGMRAALQAAGAKLADLLAAQT